MKSPEAQSHPTNGRDSLGTLVNDLIDSFPIEAVEGRTSISDFGKLLFTEGQQPQTNKRSHTESVRPPPPVIKNPVSRPRIHHQLPSPHPHHPSNETFKKGKAAPKRWSAEEDESLRGAVKIHGERNWKAIADEVPGRNHTQCLQRWTKVLAPGLVKGHWRPEEDELLRQLVAEGRKNWGQVASRIPGRTSKQCRERWYNHLDPSIVRGEYTADEDRIILEAQARLGNRWSAIAAMLPGRTEDAVKIRWKSLCRTRVGRARQVSAATAKAKAAAVAQAQAHAQMQQKHQQQLNMQYNSNGNNMMPYSNSNPQFPQNSFNPTSYNYNNYNNNPQQQQFSQQQYNYTNSQMYNNNTKPPMMKQEHQQYNSNIASSFTQQISTKNTMNYTSYPSTPTSQQYTQYNPQQQQCNTNGQMYHTGGGGGGTPAGNSNNINSSNNPNIAQQFMKQQQFNNNISTPQPNATSGVTTPAPVPPTSTSLQTNDTTTCSTTNTSSATTNSNFKQVANPVAAFMKQQQQQQQLNTNSTTVPTNSINNSGSSSNGKPPLSSGRGSIDVAIRASAMRRSTNPSNSSRTSRSSLEGFLTDLGDVGRISDLKVDDLGTMETLWRMSGDMNRLSL